jgi:membrane protein DedA with SNARE-associated domain
LLKHGFLGQDLLSLNFSEVKQHMESFLSFVHEWGYIAVFLGAIVEGETVILTASALSALGYLNFYKVMAITFCTTVVVDQLLFLVGRRYGPGFFERFPKFRPRADRAFKLLHRFDKWFILVFRFIYGIRVISPIVIGAAHVEHKRFAPLNILSAFIWTTISCYSGYAMGDVLESLLKNIEKAEHYFLIAISVIAALAGIYWLWKRYLKKN